MLVSSHKFAETMIDPGPIVEALRPLLARPLSDFIVGLFFMVALLLACFLGPAIEWVGSRRAQRMARARRGFDPEMLPRAAPVTELDIIADLERSLAVIESGEQPAEVACPVCGEMVGHLMFWGYEVLCMSCWAKWVEQLLVPSDGDGDGDGD